MMVSEENVDGGAEGGEGGATTAEDAEKDAADPASPSRLSPQQPASRKSSLTPGSPKSGSLKPVSVFTNLILIDKILQYTQTDRFCHIKD